MGAFQKSDESKGSILMGLLFVAAGVGAAAAAFFFGLLLVIFGVGSGSSSWAVSIIMIPASVLFYHSIAYRFGYRHSLEGTFNKKKSIIAAIIVFVFQMGIVLLAVGEYSKSGATGTWYKLAGLMFSQFSSVFTSFNDYMPELLYLPPFIEPVVIIISYSLSRKSEKKDHDIGGDAMAFRNRLEREQYGRDNIPAGQRGAMTNGDTAQREVGTDLGKDTLSNGDK